MTSMHRLAGLTTLTAALLPAWTMGQDGGNPFPTPISTRSDVITVDYEEFARIPFDDGNAPRLMHMITEPGTRRHFVSTMVGKLYSVSYDGRTVTEYLDLTGFGVEVMAAGSERGLQSFDFHPQFGTAGAPGYGKFYTWVDVGAASDADFTHPAGRHSQDTVLLEWTAAAPTASTYDGGRPREILRAAQPYANHNGGEAAFNPLALPGDGDFGLLYLGLADGGSGGDPENVAQNPASAFGKILRIDPLGRNGRNGQYGIPDHNPFSNDPGTLDEIYALGLRNPQRFGWDPANGRMLVADIGQNQIEEISPVTPGANLGWNIWEGSYRYVNRRISMDDPRSDPRMTWPVVEYDHNDPLLQRQVSVSGVLVYRESGIPPLQNTLIFADIPSGELFYAPADTEGGGQDAIGRILFNDAGEARTLLQLIQEENRRSGQDRASRADLRFGFGPEEELFLLNKADGVIRRLVYQRQY